MVVIVDNLHLSLKLVNLSLHKLLCNLGEELEVELNKSALHHFLTEFNGLFLALFANLPKLVRQGIGALMKLFLSLVILSKIWVLVRKLIEALNELVEDVLLSITGVQELQELHFEA